MRTGVIQAQDIIDEGRRLTGGFHVSEDQLALATIRRAKVPKSPLRSLVEGRGIFRGPIFSRVYVDGPEHGEPYVSAKDLVTADVRPAAYLSRRHGQLLEELRLREGMILVTRSGMNLGKVIWTRPELDGLVASHDLIRIEPNAKAAPPGFLFAFLAGRYGHALIRKQIYGGHIKHIEPEHIADLPVPRLKNGLEQKVHDLVKRAAHLRAEAATEISRIDASVVASLGLPDLGHASVGEFSVSSVVASRLNLRLDAAYHCDAAIRSTRAVEAARSSVALLSIVVKRYFKPPMFKRLWVDNSSYGRQFVSGADVYRYQAESTRYVSFKTPKFDDFILEEGTVIFQAAGEISGLVGRPLFVSGWLVGLFAADDLYRLVPRTVEDGGYLYTFFRTTVGQVLLKRQACGDSIPRIWDPHIRDIRVPWPDAGIRREIGSAVVHAHSKIERARLSETEAISLVEQAIEGRC